MSPSDRPTPVGRAGSRSAPACAPKPHISCLDLPFVCSAGASRERAAHRCPPRGRWRLAAVLAVVFSRCLEVMLRRSNDSCGCGTCLWHRGVAQSRCGRSTTHNNPRQIFVRCTVRPTPHPTAAAVSSRARTPGPRLPSRQGARRGAPPWPRAAALLVATPRRAHTASPAARRCCACPAYTRAVTRARSHVRSGRTRSETCICGRMRTYSYKARAQ